MRLPILVLFLLFSGIATQVLIAQEDSAPRFETYCSRTDPGNSQVEIQWPVASQGAAAADVNAAALQQVLDITVYKEGFERGLYKTIKPGAQEREFRLAKPLDTQPQDAQEIPGLQKLRLTQFATSQEQPKEGLRMLMRPIPGQQSAVAKLEGLEPGMKYFVRVSSPGTSAATLSFHAAVCPVDYVKPPKPQ